MNVGIGTVAAQFLSWEHWFRIFGIVSLQCTKYQHNKLLYSNNHQRNYSHETSPLTPLTEALGEVGLLVEKDLGRDDGPEREKCLVEVRVRELRWQVVDEQVGSFRSLVRL